MAQLYAVTNTTPKGLARGAVTQAHEAYAFPAPTLGVDSRQAYANSNPQTAVTIHNCFARSYGLELRAGYTSWGKMPDGVSAVTLMPYISHSGSTGSRLFAAASDGKVYDVTVQDIVTPAVDVATIPGQVNNGEAHWLNFVTEGGNYLVMIFPGGGYWTYGETAGFVQHIEGTAAGDIEGVDPDTFVYAFAWENRLWFVEGKTAKAWFLPVKTLAGKASMFDFGSMFTRGGELSIGASWTVDGGGDGGGMADSLVLISSEGDVLIYGGEDPTDATKFHINGRWFVGRVPVGRRYITRFGANMAVLSERGLLLMSEVLRGDGDDPQKAAASRINQILQPIIRSSMTSRFWELKVLPDVNALVINVPTTATANDYIWAFDLTAFGASQMVNFPFTNIEVYQGRSYACDELGNVWQLWSGDSDGSIGTADGADLQGFVQTAFVPLNEAIKWKRFIMGRCGFRASSAPAVTLRLNSDWSFDPPGLTPVYTVESQSLWDAAVWDVGVWGGNLRTYKAWTGISGMGHYASMTVSFKAPPGAIFTDWDCVVESGGIL